MDLIIATMTSRGCDISGMSCDCAIRGRGIHVISPDGIITLTLITASIYIDIFKLQTYMIMKWIRLNVKDHNVFFLNFVLSCW